MFKPAAMQQVNILVLGEDVDTVTEGIAEMGVMHFADSSAIEGWAGDLSPVQTAETVERLVRIEKRLHELARGIGAENLPRIIASASQYMCPADLEQEERRVAEIEAEASGLVADRDSHRVELDKLLKISDELRIFAPLGRAASGARYSFLQIETGRTQRQNLALIERALDGIPHLVMPLASHGDTVTLAAITLRRDAAVLEGALREAAFERADVPEESGDLTGDVQARMEEKIAAVRRELASREEEIATLKHRHARDLTELAERINCTKLLARARGHFRKTGRTWLISGWVPASRVRQLGGEISRLTKGHCYLETRDPGEIPVVREGKVKVPVLFNNPIFLRPFELLTSTYGVPAYNSIDPTLFVAVTFLIMFGVMFGDIGDGLVLLALGAFLALGRYKETLKRIGTLVLYCGASSLFFGFLYGSFFGVERWFTPLWIRPMQNILFFIQTAIYFGIAVVSLGILFNIIDALRTRDWIKGIFDKAGLLAGVIYWGCIGLIINSAMRAGGAGIPRSLVFLVVGFPVLLLFMKAPVARLAGKTPRLFPEGALSYFMETLIEVVEIFLGFLANTLSFIRVAAFALAHAMLFMAVFALADAVRGGFAGTLASILLIILGNMLIIVLEGLIVTIQAVRLEYYEFFGKFFTADGEQYEPIKIG